MSRWEPDARGRLMAAAIELFAEHGYARTSVRDIARAAGVSAQTVYDSVGSKQQLVAQLNDLIDADTGEVAIEAGRKLTVRTARQLAEKGLKALKVADEDLHGHYLASELVNTETGEIYAEAGDEITGKLLKQGVRPYEVPISYRARSRADGKKLTWRDGVEAVGILARLRFGRRPGR